VAAPNDHCKAAFFTRDLGAAAPSCFSGSFESYSHRVEGGKILVAKLTSASNGPELRQLCATAAEQVSAMAISKADLSFLDGPGDFVHHRTWPVTPLPASLQLTKPSDDASGPPDFWESEPVTALKKKAIDSGLLGGNGSDVWPLEEVALFLNALPAKSFPDAMLAKIAVWSSVLGASSQASGRMLSVDATRDLSARVKIQKDGFPDLARNSVALCLSMKGVVNKGGNNSTGIRKDSPAAEKKSHRYWIASGARILQSKHWALNTISMSFASHPSRIVASAW
jgi:hypothetical protein